MITKTKTRTNFAITQDELRKLRSLQKRSKKLQDSLSEKKKVIIGLLQNGRKYEEGPLRPVITTDVKPMLTKGRIAGIVGQETADTIFEKIERKDYSYLQILDNKTK